MNLEDILLRGTRAAQPVASLVTEGMLYFVTDEGIIEQQRSSAWVAYSGASLITAGNTRSNIPLVVEAEEPIDNYFPIVGSPNVTKALLAGTGITFDDTVPGFRTLSASVVPGAGAWTLISSSAVGAVASVDFTSGLDFDEIMVVIKGVTTVSATFIRIRVSIDGGAVWLTGADSDTINTSGTFGAANIDMHLSANTAARTSWMIIKGFNKTTEPKIVSSGILSGAFIINNNSALNALQIIPTTGNFAGAGNVYVYGR